jgi:hypothetical protein
MFFKRLVEWLFVDQWPRDLGGSQMKEVFWIVETDWSWTPVRSDILVRNHEGKRGIATTQLIPSSARDSCKQCCNENKCQEYETDELTMSGAKLGVASALTCADVAWKWKSWLNEQIWRCYKACLLREQESWQYLVKSKEVSIHIQDQLLSLLIDNNSTMSQP